MKLDTNWVPPSLITSLHRPWSFQMWSLNNQATPEAVTSDGIGMTWARLERQSTTTMMALYPWLHGSSVMRSTEMSCQQRSGTLLGISHPVRGAGKVFMQLHRSQPFTYSAT